MGDLINLCERLSWTFKIKKSYKRLLKVESQDENYDLFDELIRRSVRWSYCLTIDLILCCPYLMEFFKIYFRLVTKNVGNQLKKNKSLDDMETVIGFLRQLIFTLNEENSKLTEVWCPLENVFNNCFIYFFGNSPDVSRFRFEVLPDSENLCGSCRFFCTVSFCLL